MDHHAVLIKRQDITVSEALRFYGDTEDLEVYILPFSNIGIDEVKQLIYEANLKPQEKDARLLIVDVKSITIEAEQALLKIFEEPPASTRFLIVVSTNIAFIPTLKSRLYEIASKLGEVSLTSFVSFSEMAIAERFKEISKRIDTEDKAWVEEIKSGLVDYLKNHRLEQLDQRTDLAIIMNSLNSRGASNKMLLEYLAIKLPLRV